ncbi:hypothetical protein CesoFtcFv8_019556 [Champsocephalus esox]|uniref:Uncharacterized protein n=1 Tax=Champsocephalus esox TaxID=159716 RepID=A0AAN8BDH0_9TELE|nr:hypothetical protein CesoFtcFv8_019556 [Champsocephalus esox]
MFHRVFVQTQIKPGTGFWGLELWKERRAEVFSTSPLPNHVIPGRVFANLTVAIYGMADDNMVWVCDSKTTPTPPKLNTMIHQAKPQRAQQLGSQ